jgi:putative PLP-dependent aminotransferase (TIGR04422 family)
MARRLRVPWLLGSMQKTPVVSLDMWPQVAVPVASVTEADTDTLEAMLADMFPGAFPVAFSSGRAGLGAVVVLMGLTRTDWVSLPAYSSHCVIESVSRAATPVPYGAVDGNHRGRLVQLVYHPVGHMSPFPVVVSPDDIIDDAVDAYLEPDTCPLVAQRRFLVWSCSKVLGTYAGGVVFCREASEAIRLCDIRDARIHMVDAQHQLRLAALNDPVAYLQWSGAESLAGAPHVKLAGAIAESLRVYRKSYATVHKRYGALLVHDGLEHLELLPTAMPSNVAVEAAHPLARRLGETLALPLRHIPVRVGDDVTWKQVRLLPIHVGIGQAVFEMLHGQVAAFRSR